MILTQRPWSPYRFAILGWCIVCICIIFWHFGALRTTFAPTADLIRDKASSTFGSHDAAQVSSPPPAASKADVKQHQSQVKPSASKQPETKPTPASSAQSQSQAPSPSPTAPSPPPPPPTKAQEPEEEKEKETEKSAAAPKQPQIPHKIWYKTGPKGLTDDMRDWHASCAANNTAYKATYVDDAAADDYVREHYAHRPDVVRTYMGLRIPILRADFLRYLLLYNDGGVWFDLDVSCEGVPIDDWIPDRFRNRTAVVVGWEFDVGWGEGYQRQFNSWTILAEQKSPHMLQVIDDIVDAVRDTSAKHGVPVANLTLAMVGDVVDYTGPRRMTEGIFRSLERRANVPIDRARLSNLREPKMMGDVLILPGWSLSASSNKYGEEEVGPALVTHHYAGSWKNDKGGESKRRRRRRRSSGWIEGRLGRFIR